MLTTGKGPDEQTELPNLYGSGGGTSYVKGLGNDEAQALFNAWDKNEKFRSRQGFAPKPNKRNAKNISNN